MKPKCCKELKLSTDVLSECVIMNLMFQRRLSQFLVATGKVPIERMNPAPSEFVFLSPLPLAVPFYASNITAIWNKIKGNIPGKLMCLCKVPLPKTVSAVGEGVVNDPLVVL